MKLENYTPNFEADPDQIQDSLGVSDYVLDAFGSIPAGLEDLAHGVYNLGDFLSFDVLPDWDEERFFERPKTLAGDLTAALVQYAVPYGFIAKRLSMAGKLAKVFTKGKKPGKLLDLKPQGFVAADVATNFIAFDGQQERLSNLLKEVDNPAFNNAVTQYLAADPDDAELEGRMKNVLEGAMIDAGVGALFKLFSVSLKASKRFIKEVAGGANKEDAATTAMMQYQDDAKGLNIVGDIDSQMQFAKDRAETDELFRMVGGDPEDISQVDLRTVNWDEVDIEEAVEMAPAVAREEMEAIEAGGRLVDERETATAIVKTYEMPGGSTRTVMVDKANPERVLEAAGVIPKAPEVGDRFTRASISEQDKPFYVLQDNQRSEPLTREQLELKIRTNSLEPDAKIAQQGGQQWFDFSELMEGRAGAGRDVTEALGTKEELTRVGKTWEALSQTEPLFRTPKTYSGTFDDIASDLKIKDWEIKKGDDPEGKLKEEDDDVFIEDPTYLNPGFFDDGGMVLESPEEDLFKPASEIYTFQKKGQAGKIIVKEYPDSIRVNSTMADRGGASVYQALLQYAHNTGKTYYPEGLTYINELRTLSAMFSSALKNKDTKYFQLSKLQRKALSGPEADKLKDLSGSYEDDLKKLALAERNIVADRLDNEAYKLSDFEYDFNTDKFYKVEGTGEAETRTLYKDEDIVDLIEADDPGFLEGIGLTTFKRAVVTDTIMRGPKPGFRGETGVPKKALERIFPMTAEARGPSAFGAEIDPNTKEFLLKGAESRKLKEKGFKETRTEAGVVRERIKPEDLDEIPTVSNTLDQLTTNAKSPEVRNLAKSLKEIISDPEDLNVPINYDPKAGEPRITPRGTTQELGTYNPIDDNINLNKAASEETVVHEILHGVTSRKLAGWVGKGEDALDAVTISDVDKLINNTKAPKAVRDLGSSFKKAFEDPAIDNELYPMGNLDEFLVGAFTNKEFQEQLSKIPVEDNRNLFQKIVDAVGKLIGIKADGTLLEKVIRDGAEIISSSRKQAVSPEFTKGLAEFEARMIPNFKRPPLRYSKKELDETVQKMVKDTDTSSLKIGGEQAVKGLARQTGKLPEGLQVDGLAQLQDAVADEILKDGKMMNTLSEQGLEDGVIMELANLLGADGKYMKGLVKAAENDRVTLHRIMSRMAALKKLALDNGQEIINTAKNYKQGSAKMMPEEREIMEARLKGLLEQQLHIQAGHSGLASGFGRGLKSTQMGNKITLSEAELKNAQLRQEYLSKKGGMTMDQIVEGILIAEQNGGDDLFSAVIGLNKQVRGSAGGKMLDMVQEYYKNALMWGPRTLTVNYMGTGIAHVLKNFERSIGGWLSSDPAIKQAVANQWGESLSLIESSHFLLKAWQTGGQFIGDAGSAFVEGTGSSIGSITGKNVQQVLGSELSDGMKLAIDYFGNAVRIPNRFNQSVDQWYKFLQYKGRSLAQLKLKAYDLGLREPKEIAEYAHDAFEALVTRSNRNFSEQALFREADELVQGPFQTPADKSKAVADYVQGERAARLEKARQVGLVDENLDDNAAMMQLTKDYIDPNIRAAEEVTFSGELGPLGSAVQNLVTKSKIGFLVAPFVRTPTNILKFSFDRLLAPHRLGLNKLRATEAWAKLEPGYKATIDALESGGIKGMENARKTILEQMRAVKADGTPDEIVRAEARGKVAFGTMLNSALFSAVYMFGDRINGGGPEDFKQRQAWLNAGNLPYSIKMPGTETWVSYQRLDPLATMIGVFADIKDLAEDNKLNGVNESSLEHLMSVLFFTGVRNFTNKSYLSGVDQTLSVLKGQTPVGKYAGGMTAAFLPNILAQGQSITGDQELKEIRGFADIVLKKIPGVTMDLKRTPLGEPVVQEYFDGVAGILNPLNPIAFGFDNKDIAAKELGNVGHGFSMPSTKLRGVIELTDYTGPNGRSAYDRWLELSSQVKLNGMTMKQALTKLIKDKRYQALDPKSFSGIPSARVKYLTRIISRYRKAAQFQMLEEFPEIAELNRNVAAGIRSGVPREDVLELLTQ